jgi:hypothetical protein
MPSHPARSASSHLPWSRLACAAAFTAAIAGMTACGGSDSADAALPAQPLACDDSVQSALQATDNTSVLLVRAFRQGEAISLASTPPANAPRAAADVCVVKLLVGPGNPGPAGAPSTTAGIGLELWLPATAQWDGRIRADVPGAFMGSPAVTSTTSLASTTLANFAATHGTVTVTTDGGNTNGGFGDFLTLPDGTPNSLGWQQISHQAVHAMSVRTKAFAQAFYAKSPDRTYAYGCSSGGRAVYQSAQMYPKDFDGIVAEAVSYDQTQYFPALMWAQLVMQRDLVDQGLPLLSKAKRDAVSTAALRACDTAVNGTHDGYVTHYGQCAYDPTQDAQVLCASDGGSNTSAACVTRTEAQVFNKIWYGVTADGTVPAPSVDNGVNTFRTANQLWWGRKRGTGLDPVADSAGNVPSLGILGLVLDQVAWNLQDLSYTRASYVNATATGQERWKTMSYGQFAQAFPAGRNLNSTVFANIDANNPDLTAFRDAGAKMISTVGISDPFVSVEAMLNYYARSSALVGGNAQADQFHRMFLIPGRGHCGGTGSIGAVASATPQVTVDDMYFKLVDWVEKQQPPSTLPAASPDGTKSRPVCKFPATIQFLGGNPDTAISYSCT